MDCERIIVSPTQFSFVIDKDARPYTTDSTLATAAYDDDDDIESGEYSVRSSNIDKPSSSDRTSSTCTFLSYIPRCCRSIRSQHRTIVRDALLLLALASILASLIGVLVFIAIPVAMSGESSMTIRANPCMANNTNNETFHQQMTNISRVAVSDFVLGIDDVSSREEGGILFLYDVTGFRHVNLQQYQVADSSTTTGETPQAWENVQPTVGSLRQMGLQPHIQTGKGTQLEITPPLDLRADHNWTISFAGSRLHASSSSSSSAATTMNNNASESSSSSFDVIFSSSLFPFCQVQYEGSNTLGLYLEGTHSHPSNNNGNAADGSSTATTPTATIPLPFNSYEFHVLTLSYDQNSQQLAIYQNEEFVSSLNFEDGWAALNIVGGTSSSLMKDGIIGVGEIVGFGVENENDHDNDGDIQPSTNLAVQRISYFHRSFNEEEEITELVQYMTSWYP